MESVVVETLLANRRVAWVAADESLTVISIVDSTGLLGPTGGWLGEPLPHVLPELVGSEPDLEAILSGRVDP
ncbi:MAG: hypothetical protein KDI03_06520, partial [Anaerolineae bacterium]|nr:hypothetical protein [Anaerolineae bacterium]